MSAADTARHAHACGICTVPPREDGTKAPEAFWKEFQSRLPTTDELDAWYGKGRSGVGLICGAVSGGLEMLEFEGRAVTEGVWDAFLEAAEAAGLGELLERIAAGYSERTPSGGFHLLYRCSEVTGNTKLARRPATAEEMADDPDDKVKVLIETRGEGGYVVVAPSNGRVHPSGRPWEQINGGFDTIVIIDPEERAGLFDLARAFDAMPVVEGPAGPPRHDEFWSQFEGTRPGEDFEARGDWHAEILEPAGYTFVFDRGHDEYWKRPGKEGRGHSVVLHLDSGVLVPFSTATPFPETERGYRKFAAYAYLLHGGDFTTAARALSARGYGERATDRSRASTSERTSVHTTSAGTCWLSDEFWGARPLLAHIRQAAHSRQRSADAVLHAVLARAAAITPHYYKLPPIVGSSASLCYFAVGIAPPGVGKSNANAIASELLPAGTHVADQLPIGSGEGLAEVLFDVVEEQDDGGKPRKVKRQVKFNAYLYVDEGQLIGSMGRRDGSSLLPTLRTIWSGGTIGQTNASTERKRTTGQYVFGAFCGIQPGKAGALLDDADGGTPQRFAWVYASDPTIPDVPPPWPGRLEWKPPMPTGGHVVVDGHVAQLLEIAEPVATEIRSGDRARARGAEVVDVLDGHADLLALKVAALLALLDSRLDVGEEDWELARMVREASDAVRAHVVAALAAEAVERERASRDRFSRRAVEADAAVERRRIVDCARKVAGKVWAESERWTRRTLRYDLRRWREEFDDGLEHALAEGWVIEASEASHTGDDRRLLRPGSKRPT